MVEIFVSSDGLKKATMESNREKGKDMGIGWFLIIIAAWVLLQAVILPKMGIST
jgi:hypothetical protein